MRERLVSLCPEPFKESYRQILLNDLIILRLISCDLHLLTDNVGKCLCFMKSWSKENITIEDLCREQQLLCVNNIGPWVEFPETEHEGYAHLAELIGGGGVVSIQSNKLAFKVQMVTVDC